MCQQRRDTLIVVVSISDGQTTYHPPLSSDAPHPRLRHLVCCVWCSVWEGRELEEAGGTRDPRADSINLSGTRGDYRYQVDAKNIISSKSLELCRMASV